MVSVARSSGIQEFILRVLGVTLKKCVISHWGPQLVFQEFGLSTDAGICSALSATMERPVSSMPFLCDG